MNCKYQGRNQPLNRPKKLIISRSQPTTKRANKFIIQNIKIATTPVVPIPLGLQDVVKIATPDSCSPDYKISRTYHQMEQRSNKRAKSSRCQDRTNKRNKDQINGQKVQDVKIAPLNGPKNDQISRLQPPKSSRNYSCSPKLPVLRSQPLNGPKVQISKKIATINGKNKIK